MKIQATTALISSFACGTVASSRSGSSSSSHEAVGASRVLKAMADHRAAIREAIDAPVTMLKSEFSSFFGTNNEQLDNLFPATRRSLQDGMPMGDMMGEMMGDMCTPAVVFVDDDDNLARFADDYQPMCTCDESDLDFAGFVGENPVPAITDMNALNTWIGTFNSALNNAAITENVYCKNGCNACFDDYCVMLEETTANSMELGLTEDFTLIDLAAIGVDADPAAAEAVVFERLLVESVTNDQTECVDVKSGPALGKVCFSIMLDYQPDEPPTFNEFNPFALLFNGTVSCAMTYNGDDCTSCTLGIDDLFDSCIDVDCTNLVDGAMISYCESQDDATNSAGFVGALEPYFLLSVANETSVELTMGDCMAPDDATTTGTDSPTSAPVAETAVTDAPTPAPVESSVETPEDTSIDSSACFGAFKVVVMALTALTAAVVL